MTTILTEKEFLALPDNDEIDRELIRGELRERALPIRGWAHSLVLTQVNGSLYQWNKTQPLPRGRLCSGDILIRLTEEPLTFVGADFAYVAPEAVPKDLFRARYLDGPPSLVIEIIAPDDTQAEINDKITRYLETGVPLLWIIDPQLFTVTVYERHCRPQILTVDHDLEFDAHLLGCRIAVADLFEDLMN